MQIIILVILRQAPRPPSPVARPDISASSIISTPSYHISNMSAEKKLFLSSAKGTRCSRPQINGASFLVNHCSTSEIRAKILINLRQKLEKHKKLQTSLRSIGGFNVDISYTCWRSMLIPWSNLTINPRHFVFLLQTRTYEYPIWDMHRLISLAVLSSCLGDQIYPHLKILFSRPDMQHISPSNKLLNIFFYPSLESR